MVVIDFFFFAQSQQRAQGPMIGSAKVHGPPAFDTVSEQPKTRVPTTTKGKSKNSTLLGSPLVCTLKYVFLLYF